jgi:subtilisin family serine protease
MSADSLEQTLGNMGLPVIRRLTPRGFGLMSAGSGSTEVLVTEMPIERGEALRASAPPDVIVEQDQPLVHHGALFSTMDASPQLSLPAPPGGAAVPVRVKVADKDGKPAVGATVTIYGQAFPAHGDTDEKGLVEIAVSGGLGALQAVYVKPRADFWEKVLLRPQLDPDQPNVITLQRFSETFAGFPKQKMVGWGQKLMGLDQLDDRFDGAGAKVGIMDSGCDNSHPQLRHVTNGDDLVARDGGTGWTDDVMSHGTHCAGIIGARSADRFAGIRGFAPAAEIHAIKVFPSGRISDLIDALDIAVQRQLDVMNMSLGSADPSELVQQKLETAVAGGVACIVAAGNSSGPVQFPGLLPQSITIAAVGQLGQYPQDSYHAMTVGPGGPGPEGIFPAKFSCFGPQVRLSAPGVAIISTVPKNGYAAWDGTSMATPHVTGLSALVMAHHPALKGLPRDGNRVAALFKILQSSARPVVADPLRGGFGLPHAPTALAQASAGGAAPSAPVQQVMAGAPAMALGTGGATVVPPAGGAPALSPEFIAQLQLRAALGDPTAQRMLMLLSGML